MYLNNDLALKSLAIFRRRVMPMPWCPRSILLSEAFAFCAMCDRFNVTAVIESGICNGRSTEIWAKYLSGVKITAIDWLILPEVRERLAKYPISLIEYEAVHALPLQLQGLIDHRVGVFIDGPKDGEALSLAQKCLEYPQVAFVGVHDMARLVNGKPHAARQKCEALPYPKWFTDVDWFLELARDLDADESHWDHEQGTRWTPGYRSEKHSEPMPLGSYGYTIGFLVNG